jgi:hypothetical protein
MRRLWAELEEAEWTLTEDYQLQTEPEPEVSHYYIEFVPGKDTQQALLATHTGLYAVWKVLP